MAGEYPQTAPRMRIDESISVLLGPQQGLGPEFAEETADFIQSASDAPSMIAARGIQVLKTIYVAALDQDDVTPDLKFDDLEGTMLSKILMVRSGEEVSLVRGVTELRQARDVMHPPVALAQAFESGLSKLYWRNGEQKIEFADHAGARIPEVAARYAAMRASGIRDVRGGVGERNKFRSAFPKSAPPAQKPVAALRKSLRSKGLTAQQVAEMLGETDMDEER